MRTTEDQRPLPFSIRLDDFKLVRYPGSHSPSSFESFLTIHTEEGERSEHIYMNKVIYEQDTGSTNPPMMPMNKAPS